MIISIFLLIIGFVLLIKGADFLIDGAASLASNFKISKLVIGLTIMAFGTSLPEFAISMQALAAGSTDMVLGNVIGSNILNILLILGIACAISPITIKDSTIKKEFPLALLISTLLVVILLDVKLANASINQLTRSDAIVILLFFLVFIYYLITLLFNQKNNKNDNDGPQYNISKSFVLFGIGIVGIIFGSNLVVNNAKNIAAILGLSERLIALTIVAFGTSLPELVTTVTSSIKKEQDLLLGNLIGSNIFNICVVLGIPVAIFGSISPVSFQTIDLYMLIFSAFLTFIFATTHKKISRIEGIIAIVLFAIYYFLVFVL